MMKKVQNSILDQIKVNILSAQIVTTLHLQHKDDEEVFKRQDIYNVKAALRQSALSSLTSVQALIQNLN